MGAIERNGYTFEPEYSVIKQNGAIHVYHHGKFVEEIQFEFNSEFLTMQIEELVNHYYFKHNI